MTKILRVLIVDDEPLALDYMETILASVGDVEVVGRCRSGREALIELQKCEVDLMFLDIQMPGLNGLEVVKRCQSDVMPVVAAFFVDGVDGPLARKYDVKTNAARFVGVLLDLIIDYLTYVFIPAFALFKSGLLPGWTGWIAIIIITFASAMYFCD